MQIFISFYILLVSFSLLLTSRQRKVSSKVFILLSLLLFIFYTIVIGLRDFDMQGDTRNYLAMFHQAENDFSGLISSRIEYGFVLLLKGLSLIDLSERQFIFSVAVLQSCLWFVALKKYFTKPVFLLLSTLIFISMFFFYNLGSNVLRQGLAMPFLILAMHYLFKGHKFRFVAMSVLSFLFHKTTLGIILIMYIVFSLKIKTTTWLAILALTTLFSITNTNRIKH
ncbi:EpsG family protein [Aeromonas caviae]|uniref:EpsG family protein n=1 Tax=Aeromonas caviae TaxID=648 RepID=UPI000DEA3981|nr:EpsG family protein [Aeromonas caviae]RCE12933.1 hypothetical protein C6B42_20000 [Aeromonas caviae]